VCAGNRLLWTSCRENTALSKITRTRRLVSENRRGLQTGRRLLGIRSMVLLIPPRKRASGRPRFGDDSFASARSTRASDGRSVSIFTISRRVRQLRKTRGRGCWAVQAWARSTQCAGKFSKRGRMGSRKMGHGIRVMAKSPNPRDEGGAHQGASERISQNEATGKRFWRGTRATGGE
jgi:hypothetical protein